MAIDVSEEVVISLVKPNDSFTMPLLCTGNKLIDCVTTTETTLPTLARVFKFRWI